MTVPYCRIGRFELHPESGLLLDGVPVKLGGRAFDLLLALVARAGQIVPKEALMDAVWPSLTVADNNLTVQCAALRRELARGFPAGQVVIETVPGRGYRLTVTPLGRPESAAQLGNLPAPVTRLIGRESDAAAIGMGLARARLLTVLGIGGIGKTTVAIAAARAAWGAFPDGIWFVGLGAHADPNLVPAAVAASLGINTRRGTSLADVLAALRDQRALLLLDNCEHLIGGVAHTAEALLGGWTERRRRWSCFWIAPPRPATVWRQDPKNGRSAPRSAAVSMAFHWRSNSQPPACASLRRRKFLQDSMADLIFSSAAAAQRNLASKPYGQRSTGATICWSQTRACCSAGFRSSPAGSVPRQRLPWRNNGRPAPRRWNRSSRASSIARC
jgi:DNA-binding winged helix-turn-helix (wHTH) protein